MLSGDLGHSLFFNAPVVDLILARLGPTILLVIAAMSIALTLGTFLGVLASRKPGVVANLVAVARRLFRPRILDRDRAAPRLLRHDSAPALGMYDVRLESAGLVRALDVASGAESRAPMRLGSS